MKQKFATLRRTELVATKDRPLENMTHEELLGFCSQVRVHMETYAEWMNRGSFTEDGETPPWVLEIQQAAKLLKNTEYPTSALAATAAEQERLRLRIIDLRDQMFPAEAERPLSHLKEVMDLAVKAVYSDESVEQIIRHYREGR